LSNLDGVTRRAARGLRLKPPPRWPQTPDMENAGAKALLLFDGVCNFCNGAVLFLIDRDPRERLVFASLQSELGQATLRAHGLLGGGDDLGASASMVLIEEGRVYQRSAAALRLVRLLRWPWPLLYAAVLVPRAVRDWAYDTFAARRYWFGQSNQCRVPTPELRRRFIT
jgi:predicted DCC family thiol-disulfide oxidoreductase YuxK